MNKKTKMILGLAVAVGVGYWLYKKYGKSSTSKFSGFTADSDFFNAVGMTSKQGRCVNISGLSNVKCCFPSSAGSNPPIGTRGETSSGDGCYRTSSGAELGITRDLG